MIYLFFRFFVISSTQSLVSSSGFFLLFFFSSYSCVRSQYIYRLKLPTQKYFLGSFRPNTWINSFILLLHYILYSFCCRRLYIKKKYEKNRTWERNESMNDKRMSMRVCVCARACENWTKWFVLFFYFLFFFRLSDRGIVCHLFGNL